MRTENPTQGHGGRQLVVGAALVDDVAAPTRLLAARRTEPAELAGGWELPGGKVDPGESPLLALHREISEELGVDIVVGPAVPGPLPGTTWPLGDRYEMLVWLVEVVGGDPRPIEDHDQLRWLDRGALHDVPWLPADRPIVETIAARMHSPTPRP
ncbi:MAG: (deoxy)nucleoside triphosphate pyrophosphohydrolase [Intrasporangium sp.]|uniref:(deoxy)nucleoside triphosphate pyrophosphohydrolase n=1 Tax=Intrasporangium sp. TaxID=1925024 RepID=UPI002647E951|nr:(deoxy)nucleoside triphosphate pyrophosphohydrolase [Intrasporangium sp.]MDN5794302.1 (deoxy)nucleoside triphosphate pyrophosphohydrolase [Intrasporangium sp.]